MSHLAFGRNICASHASGGRANVNLATRVLLRSRGVMCPYTGRHLRFREGTQMRGFGPLKDRDRELPFLRKSFGMSNSS